MRPSRGFATALEHISSRVATPPSYVLASYRAFPSLEPKRFQPVASSVLGLPLRRDILWRAVVYEADSARVGSSNSKNRADMGYSRAKLRPQKGSGRARMGDRGSPTRHDGGRAFARRAPFDWSTELPKKVYGLAVRTALSHQYSQGKLWVIDQETELVTPHPNAGDILVKNHGLKNMTSVVFVVDEFRDNLHEATKDKYGRKIEIISKEGVQVRDLLKAQRLIIESKALEWLSEQYSDIPLNPDRFKVNL